MADFNKIDQPIDWKSGTPNIYPAKEEKTTLTARPALVIALKSMNIDFIEIVLDVKFNVVLIFNFQKTDANVIYS